MHARTPIIMVLLGMTPLLPSVADAQNELTAALQALECARIEQDRERLRCYDDALRPAAAAAPARTAPAAPAASAAGRSAEAPPSAATAAPAERAPRTVEVPARTAPPPATARTAEARTAEPEPVRVRVVEARGLAANRLLFVTDDGQMWRQTDGRRARLDEPPFTAEIRPGALGSWFLVPEDRPAIRVRRER